jgi:hypothetical protein
LADRAVVDPASPEGPAVGVQVAAIPAAVVRAAAMQAADIRAVVTVIAKKANSRSASRAAAVFRARDDPA